MKRKSAILHAIGRRAIPLHWNERCQDKREDLTRTVIRRSYNRKVRSQANQQLRAFVAVWEDADMSGFGNWKFADPLTRRDGWEDFVPLAFKKDWID